MIDIRASSLPELFDCPARWEAKHLNGLRLPTGGSAQLGTAVHAGTAAFDQGRIDGSGLTAEDAAGAVVDAIHQPAGEVDWNSSDWTPQTAEKVAISLHKKYCGEVAPGIDYLAVEADAGRLEISDIGIALTGHVDRVYADESGKIGIADLKTGKNAVAADGTVNTTGHAAQLAVYALLAESALDQPVQAPAVIIGLQTAKTEKGQRVGVGKIDAAREILVGNEHRPGLLDAAAGLLKSGIFYGNPRSRLCSKKYCPAWEICRWR